MEKYEIYRFIHFTGIFVLLFAFGSLFTGEKTTKGAAIGHGIGLLLILLGGFGMHSSPLGGSEFKLKDTYNLIYGTKWPTWLILKLVIWMVFGASMVLAKRRIIKGVVAWVLIIGLALCSAWLAYQKPAMGNTPKAAQSE